MDFSSIMRFGNLAIGMLNTPQVKNMAKFVVPFLNSPPASPSPESSQPSSNPAAGGHQSMAGRPMHGSPNVPPYMGNGFPMYGFQGMPGMPGMQGMPGSPRMPGMPGTGPQSNGRQSRPRLGGLQALQGLIGNSSPAGSSAANPSGQPLAPFRQVMKYATPQNMQKVMEWHGVLKQFAGMVGLGGSAASGGAAGAGNAAASANSVKAPKQLRISEASAQKKSGSLAADRKSSTHRGRSGVKSKKSSGKGSAKQKARSR